MPRVGIRKGKLCVIDDKTAADSSDTATNPPSHSDSIEVINRGRLQQELLPLGLQLCRDAGIVAGDVLILIVDNDSTSVGVIAAARQLHCFFTLIGKSRLAVLDHIVTDTGITKSYIVDHSSKRLHQYENASSKSVRVDGKPAWYRNEAELATHGGMGFLTSGTCGKPKVVVMTWSAVLGRSEQWIKLVQDFRNDALLQLICCTSIAHAYSFNAVFNLLSQLDEESDSSSEDRSHQVFLVSENHSQLLQFLGNDANASKENLTVIIGSPGSYAVLIHAAKGTNRQLHVDIALCGGTSLTFDLYKQVKRYFNVQLVQGYGTTETGHISQWDMDPLCIDKERSVYERAVEECPPRFYLGSILLETKIEFGLGGTELLVQTPWQAIGYVRNCEIDSIRGKFHHTGDKVFVESCENSGKRRIWLYGRIRPELQVLDPRCLSNTTFSPVALEATLTEEEDITDALVAVQKIANSATKVIVDIVCNDRKTARSIEEYQKVIAAWFATNKSAVALDLIHVEVKDYLSCSPAGKLVFDLTV